MLVRRLYKDYQLPFSYSADRPSTTTCASMLLFSIFAFGESICLIVYCKPFAIIKCRHWAGGARRVLCGWSTSAVTPVMSYPVLSSQSSPVQFSPCLSLRGKSVWSRVVFVFVFVFVLCFVLCLLCGDMFVLVLVS